MCSMVQVVEGVCQEVHSIAQEMEWTELPRELENLRDNQRGYYETSGEDLESAGSWRIRSEVMEEWSSEKWRTSAELESEDLMESKESEDMGALEELEGEKEVEKEVEGGKEEEMIS